MKPVILSLLKHWVTIVLGLIVAHGGIIGLDWVNTLNASLVAFIPVVVNYLNPSYKEYGNGKDKQ